MNQSLTRHKWEPYLWLLPSLILMGIFLVYPIMIVFKLSFSEISRSGVVGGFNGLKNYITAVTAPEFGSVMVNTAIWVVSVVGISTLLGFIVALVLNTDFRGRKIARSIVVFPWAATLVVQASMWKYIINIEYGALNKNGNTQARVNYTAYATVAAAARNIPIVWWDNNSVDGSGENFGIIDRKNITFFFPEIVETMVRYGGYDRILPKD